MKIKRKILFFTVVTVFILFSFTVATAIMMPVNENAENNSKAAEKSSVFGENGGLEKMVIELYVKDTKSAKPPSPPGKTETCYDLLGVTWKTLPVDYTINPTNPEGLTTEFVLSTIYASAETWDAETSAELFNNYYTVDTNAHYGTLDGENVIEFGDNENSNIIGVTSIWYSRRSKEIVEFDIQFNTDFEWGDATVDPSKMDLMNIAVHELGHAVGMGDVYSTTCSEVTMYGYSTEGEIIKRTLEEPDIIGLQTMYGE